MAKKTEKIEKSEKSGKPQVYLATPVFREIADHQKVSKKSKEKVLTLWKELNSIANVSVSDKRFPSTDEITNIVKEQNVDFIGCHLSHKITKEVLAIPSVKAVCTSTMGFDHIENVPGILMTHTPSVMDKTVADFTISLILGSLRNLVNLHNFLWDGKWNADQKWDLDENLNNTIDNLTLGLLGLGEIGREIVRRIGPWGVKILYYDIARNPEFEQKYPNLSFCDNMDKVFSEADIVSVHIPLMPQTKGIVGEKYLKMMKPYSLLINTARGPIVDFKSLVSLLKSKEISINLGFDVFDPEPISKEILNDFKQIAQARPELRFLFIPHNASADADTRAEMSCIVLSDLIALIKSHKPEDLKSVRFIPSQRKLKDAANFKEFESYRMNSWWK